MCSGDYVAQQLIVDGLRGGGSISQETAASALSLAYQKCPTATDYGAIFGSLAHGETAGPEPCHTNCTLVMDYGCYMAAAVSKGRWEVLLPTTAHYVAMRW